MQGAKPDHFRYIVPDCCKRCKHTSYLNDYRASKIGWFCILHAFKFRDHSQLQSGICDDFERAISGAETK